MTVIATATRGWRAILALLVAGVGAFGLTACGTTIGQARSTQLSLFCVVVGGETRASVYQLVGAPSYAGNSARAMPRSVRSWGFDVPHGAGGSWAAWVDSGTSYLAVFRHGRIAAIDMRRGARSHPNWHC
jgi:hypothetical protein